MRKLTVPTLAALVVLVAASALAAEPDMYKSESGWFDMNHCAFCKNLTADPGLLPHSTWETHEIENGMVEIITVAPEYKESFAKAGRAMQELGMKIQKGEVNPMTLEMCGRCKEFGMLQMTGIKTEAVMGDAATVFIYTSDNPDVVKKMHDIVARDHKEMALMMGAGQEQTEHPQHHEHPGHDH